MNNPDFFAEARTQLHTVRDCVRFAVSRFNQAGLFFGHGSDNAYDEAVYLILHTLHLPPDQLEPFLDSRLTLSEVHAVLSVLDRRINDRVPAAYLTHEAWLGEHRFYVDERVIVPRAFIAELLHDQLAPWVADTDAVSSVLDLCTGSGCLAILAALAFKAARIDAVDFSPDALAVAAINIAAYDLDAQIELIYSDLFQGVHGRTYDLILSNPPYVNDESMAMLPHEYRHEPAIALGSGNDGLDATRRILAQAHAHLNPEGLLIVEIGHNRDVLEATYPHLPFTWLDTSAGDQHVFLLRREELPS